MDKAPWLKHGSWLPILIGQALVFGFASQMRFIDGDEGYLLLAAKLVAEGKAPYLDFFFPQGPLLPYVYAGLLGPFGIGWRSARFLSGLFAACNGLLIVVSLARRGESRSTRALGAFLFATTALIFAWLPIAKTYALSSLLLTGAYVASIPRRNEKSATARSILVGLLCALATGVRLYCVAALPILMLLLERGLRGDERRQAGIALASFVLGLLPSLAICASHWPNAFHGLIGYHLSRSHLEVAESLRQKFVVIKELLGLGPTGHALGLQVLGLLLLLAISARKKSSDVSVGRAIRFALALALVSLLPTPTFVQYFVLAVPFVIEAAAMGGSRLAAKLPSKRARIIMASLLCGYAMLGAWEWNRYHLKGNGVLGVDRPSAWTLSAAVAVGNALDLYTECGPIIASWPGYLLESSAVSYAGLENHFSTLAGDALPDADERRRHHVLSTSDIDELVASRAASTVVIGNWQRDTFGSDPTPMLERAGYQRVSTWSEASVWASPSSACAKKGPDVLPETALNEPAGVLPAGGGSEQFLGRPEAPRGAVLQ